MNKNLILEEDLKQFSLPNEIIREISDKLFIVTGATGLIGSILVKCLTDLDCGIRFILPVRDKSKAQRILGTRAEYSIIETSDLCEYFKNCQEKADYLIHCACPTSGNDIVSHPVRTANFIIDTTNWILQYAYRNSIKSMVYLSSIEVYGENYNDNLIDEDYKTCMDIKNKRNIYGHGKSFSELLCLSYAEEYNVKVKIARPTQVFGAGISQNDNRVFAQFARSIITNQDIILHTKGLSAKPYCYTTDCVSAILYILCRGQNGESYNIATPNTYISIYDLALFLKSNFNNSINISIDTSKNNGYAPTTRINLSSDKLMKLGWKPRHDLFDMFDRLIRSLI